MRYYIPINENSLEAVISLELNEKPINGIELGTFKNPYFKDNTYTEIVEGVEKIEVPQEVQLWRIRVVLKLLSMEQVIETALNSLDEPMKTGALYIWSYGTTIERNSQTVQLLQYVLGLTSSQVDDIFIQANNIQL